MKKILSQENHKENFALYRIEGIVFPRKTQRKFSSIQDGGKISPEENIRKIFLYPGWKEMFSQEKHRGNFPLSWIQENFPYGFLGTKFSFIPDRENFLLTFLGKTFSSILDRGKFSQGKHEGNFLLFRIVENFPSQNITKIFHCPKQRRIFFQENIRKFSFIQDRGKNFPRKA